MLQATPDASAMSPAIPPMDEHSAETARQLIPLLPIENNIEFEERVRNQITMDAVAWVDHVHPGVGPDTKWQFVNTVTNEVHAELTPSVITRARDFAGEMLATRMHSSDLAATAAFLSTPSGRAYAKVAVGHDKWLIDFAASEIFDKIRDRLPQIFSAVEDREVYRNKINKDH